jgi:hypothetical protein
MPSVCRCAKVNKGNLRMKTPTHWLEQIEQVCATADVHKVDVLLGQAGWGACAIPVLEAIHPKVPWFSLFTGTPEENLLDQAPLLMRLDLTIWRHEAWLEDLIEHAASEDRLLLLISPLPFDELSHALRALSQLQWGGQSGLLRFYDPRIFPMLINSILTPGQREHYLGVASYWGWLDRDQRAQWLQGHCLEERSRPDVPPYVELNDEQFERMGRITDAHKLLNGGKFEDLGEGREQRFALLYSLISQASQENYFGNLSEYVKRRLNT